MKKTEIRERSLKKIIFIVGLVVLFVGMAAFGGFYCWRYYQVMRDPAKYIDIKKYAPTVEEENKQLLDEIGKLIKLPDGEVPIISTIKDVDQLKKDPFFENATNGDRLVIYQNAKQAVLYREGEHKIIKAGPVVLPDTTKKKVAIIAGAEDTAIIEQKISQSLSADAEVGTKASPTVGNDALIVVDLSGSNAQLAQKLATELNGTVAAEMPAGEPKPASGDLVVIAASMAP